MPLNCLQKYQKPKALPKFLQNLNYPFFMDLRFKRFGDIPVSPF